MEAAVAAVAVGSEPDEDWLSSLTRQVSGVSDAFVRLLNPDAAPPTVSPAVAAAKEDEEVDSDLKDEEDEPFSNLAAGAAEVAQQGARQPYAQEMQQQHHKKFLPPRVPWPP